MPELKEAITQGEIPLSHAGRLTSIITPENKDKWLKSAKELSRKALETEIVKENPGLRKKKVEINHETIKPICNAD